MKQSNFSLTDEQLKNQFPILAQPASTKMFVAAIGDPFTTPSGDTQIPVMLVQKANRFNNGDDFASVAFLSTSANAPANESPLAKASSAFLPASSAFWFTLAMSSKSS